MPLFKVEDMSCAHCVGAIENAVKALDAGATVRSDLASKTVDVSSQADPTAVLAALAEAGYEARTVTAPRSA